MIAGPKNVQRKIMDTLTVFGLLAWAVSLISRGYSRHRFLFSRDKVWLTQLCKRLADDHSGTLQCERGHDCRHDHIRPTCLGAEHAGRSQQYSEISEHIVPSEEAYYASRARKRLR